MSLHRPRPKREWIGILDKAAERLERGHGLQVDRKLLSIPARRPAVDDFDVEAGQAVALVISTSSRRVGPSKSDNVRLHQSGVANRRNTVRSNHGRRFPNRWARLQKTTGH
jgi:hypothetical protein